VITACFFQSVSQTPRLEDVEAISRSSECSGSVRHLQRKWAPPLLYLHLEFATTTPNCEVRTVARKEAANRVPLGPPYSPEGGQRRIDGVMIRVLSEQSETRERDADRFQASRWRWPSEGQEGMRIMGLAWFSASPLWGTTRYPGGPRRTAASWITELCVLTTFWVETYHFVHVFWRWRLGHVYSLMLCSDSGIMLISS